MSESLLSNMLDLVLDRKNSPFEARWRLISDFVCMLPSYATSRTYCALSEISRVHLPEAYTLSAPHNPCTFTP